MGPEGGSLEAPTEAAILQARGRGDPLDSTTRQSFEAVLGADFSAVRIHDDPAAHALSDELNAHAFTTGSDIFFGRRGYVPSTPSGRELLAHELSHVAQQGAATSGTAPLIHRNYAGLSPMGRKRVDQEIEETYQTKALQFETGMARLIEANAGVNALVDTLVTRVKTIVDAWAAHTGVTLATTYMREFGFTGGDAYYGAFDMAAANITTILATPAAQPLRVKLKLIYNAVRNNNLAKWLKLAAVELDRQARLRPARTWHIRTDTRYVERLPGQPGRLHAETTDLDVTPGFAHDSGLDVLLSGGQVTNIATAHARERQTVGTGFLWATSRDVFDQRNFGSVLGWKPETAKADRERRGGATPGLTLDQQRTLTVADVPNLTDAEVDLILKRQGNLTPDAGARATYRGTGANRVPWNQGGEYYDIKLGSESARVAEQIKGRLEAGISGSTDLMLHAFEYLGVAPGSNQAKALRLGLAGWMIANRDHSFYEVYKAAVPYGLPFTVDPNHPGAEYEVPDHLLPMQRADFAGILPDDGPLNNVFPADYFSVAYKDHVANGLVAPGDTQAQIHTALQAIGLSSTALSTMSERETAALQRLDALVQAQAINPLHHGDVKKYAVRQIRLHPAFIQLGNVYGQDRAETILNVLLRHHHAGAGVSQDDLRTRLADRGVPRAILDHVNDVEVGRIDAVRQAIEAAPVPAFTPGDMLAIDAATNQVASPERDTIKWNLIAKLRPAWALGANEQNLANTLERRAQLEQIADMERTTAVWYSWGNVGSLQGYITAPSLRAATRGVPSTQGPGLYIGRDVTTSAGYGDQAGQRCLVIKLDNVPTINAQNAAQRDKLRMLQPRKPTADVLDAAFLYDREVSLEILMIYGGGRFGRLTTNKGVTLTMDLKQAPIDHLRAQYGQAGRWPGQSRQNLRAQAVTSGINTVGW